MCRILYLFCKMQLQIQNANIFSLFPWKLAQNRISSILIVKNLKIGNCREFVSKQSLYLEVVVRICSHLSGNQRNFEKMSENDRKSVFFFCELVFYFHFSFFKFFLDRNQVYEVLGGKACPFFRIFALLCRKFFLSNTAHFS